MSIFQQTSRLKIYFFDVKYPPKGRLIYETNPGLFLFACAPVTSRLQRGCSCCTAAAPDAATRAACTFLLDNIQRGRRVDQNKAMIQILLRHGVKPTDAEMARIKEVIPEIPAK